MENKSLSKILRFIFTVKCLCLLLINSLDVTTTFAHDGELPPMVRKNVNEATTFFGDETQDRANLEAGLNQDISQSMRGLENGEAATLLKSDGEAVSHAEELGRMDLNEAESKGFDARAENNEFWSKAFIDYNDPMVIRHEEDIDDLAKATNKLQARLAEMYKELDIDCAQVKGPEDIEPEIYIETERLSEKEVTYDKHMCEQLRNTYSCNDTLTMSCKTKGMEWGEWQDKVITVSGDELVDYKNDLLQGDHVAAKTFEFKLFIGVQNSFFGRFDPDPGVVDRTRVYLSTKHENATKDNIDITMRAEWVGGIHSISGRQYGGRTLGSKDYVWANYNIYYRYRDGKPACLEWQESWDEKCTLK